MTPSPPGTPQEVLAHYGADANWDLKTQLVGGDVQWIP